jgi:hypothetical protein
MKTKQKKEVISMPLRHDISYGADDFNHKKFL